MKFTVKTDEEKVEVKNEKGQVVLLWDKKTLGDKNVLAALRAMFKNVEFVEE